jgi:hypothetical protein
MRCLRYLLVVLLATTAGADEWVLGGSGTDWISLAKTAAQIDAEAAEGTIQLKGFTPDENIFGSVPWSYGKPTNLLIEAQAASMWDNTARRSNASLSIVDGDSTTSTENLFKTAGQDQNGRVFFFDLGSRVPAERISFFPRQEGADASARPFAEAFLRAYEVQFSDGTKFVTGQPIYQLLRFAPVNPNSIVDFSFPPQFVRFLRLRVGGGSAVHPPFELAEFELYGDGFVPSAFYESNVVNLRGVSNYGSISWSEQGFERLGDELVPADDTETSVVVRMKTGADDTPLVHFRRVVDPNTREVSQEVVSESEYAGLNSAEAGDIIEDFEQWSPWSLPLQSGQQIPLPSPRSFFQLQIELESNSVQQTVRIDSLVIEHSVPPATIVQGEISIDGEPSPDRGIASVEAGESVTFVYDVSASFAPTQTGFDALRINTPTPPVFRSLLMGNPLVEVQPDEVTSDENGINIIFSSNKVLPSNNLPIRVLFDGSVVIFNSIFEGRVWDTQSTLLGQPVLGGDANPAVQTNSLLVALTKDSVGEILRDVDVSTDVFTPNGDGVNDEVVVEYTITQLSTPRRVELAVYDLNGRKVSTLVDADQIGGIYTVNWNGRNADGSLVPPGIYLLVTEVNSGVGSFKKVSSLGVAY